MTAVARAAANAADRSSDGSAWQSDPPTVPHSRTTGSATTRSASWKIGKCSPATAESSRSACRARAPMRSWSPSRRMKASSVSPLMSTSISGWASRSFIIGIRLWPPATTRVSGLLNNVSAWSTLVARSYSTCEGTCMYASFGLPGCCATAAKAPLISGHQRSFVSLVAMTLVRTADGLGAGEVAVKYLSGLGQEPSLRERLLDEGHVGLEAALGGQDGPGVAGHEEHFDTGLDRPHLIRDFLAEQARHDHGGDQQVDLAWMRAGDVEGLRAVRGGDHVVAVAGEDPLGYQAQGFFVLDDQDGLSFGRPPVGHGCC